MPIEMPMQNVWLHTTKELIAPPAVLALRCAVANAIPRLAWRRHGIGMLQGYLREGEGYECRVHIWHPALVRPGIVEHGDIHNHRFDMTSIVLHGKVHHTEVHRDWATNGEYGIFTCVHAREDVGARYQRQGGGLDPEASHLSLDKIYGVVTQGFVYYFPKGAFHQSSADELTVTVVTKHNQSASMRAEVISKVRTRHGGEWFEECPVHAFEADDNIDMQPVLKEAVQALLR